MYPVFFLGIIAAGGRFTGSNPSYTSTELGHHLAISQAKFIITCKAQLDVVRTAAVVKGVSFDRIIVIDDHAGANTTLHVSMNTLLQNCEKPWRTFTSVSASQSTTAALMSTSGTTGLPKMAARSHLSWIAENEAIEDKCPKPYEVSCLFSLIAERILIIIAGPTSALCSILPRIRRTSCSRQCSPFWTHDIRHEQIQPQPFPECHRALRYH